MHGISMRADFIPFEALTADNARGDSRRRLQRMTQKRVRHALFDGTVWQKGMDLQREGVIRKGLKVQRHCLFIPQHTSQHRLTILSRFKGPLPRFPRSSLLRQTTTPTRRYRRQRNRQTAIKSFFVPCGRLLRLLSLAFGPDNLSNLLVKVFPPCEKLPRIEGPQSVKSWGDHNQVRFHSES